jgi:serine/threonine-protein kinase PknG
MTCTQAGCDGTIVDGYCDVCGAPAGAPPQVESAAVESPSTAAGSTRTGTNRLRAAPIGSTRTGSTRTARTSVLRHRRHGRLGAGITTVPPQPVSDPRSAVMAVPSVAEDKRFCPSCGNPVGRSRDGRPGRTEGFCPTCRSPFSFSPKLGPGDTVGGQYEVVGCLAHGGLGWIYLAQDKNVSDRWVVLKGLLNSGDVEAYHAAIAEKQFLAEVQHPLIVEIYNFVIHDGAGYIVMEYVGGRSLKSILKERMRANDGRFDPIPVDQAIAYIVEILPAIGYLHDNGLLYCDFKPDNVIQEGDSLKLIDLGGVRRVDDEASAIYGTVGFQAPEVPEIGPTIAGDIYTVGRTLAVLSMEFRGYQSTYVDHLPDTDEAPLFQQHDSLYRLLSKACAADPADRFQSTEELREQLLGVLREIVSLGSTAAGHSTPSALFETPAVAGADLDWTQLPALKVDPSDANAAWLAAVSVDDPAAHLDVLSSAPSGTVEVQLARALAAVEAGRPDALDVIDQVLTHDPWEWRAVWLQGLQAMATGDHSAEVAAFNAVYGQVPGELAPKLALALACEHDGQIEVAESLYTVCARTDAAFAAPAAFGIARLRIGAGDTTGSLAALDLVPATSRAWVDARRTRAELLAVDGSGLPELAEAAASLRGVNLDPGERERLLVKVFEQGIHAVRRDGPAPSVMLDGVPAEERELREAAESAYRSLAALTPERSERVRLVDAANRIRPRTLL